MTDPDGFVPDFAGTVRIDTLRGGGPVTTEFAGPGPWSLRGAGGGPDTILRPAAPDDRNWKDPRVGWGVILPETAGLDAAALATADDAPEPIKALVADRGGKVLRYRSGVPNRRWTVRNWSRPEDLTLATSPRGMGDGELPGYLLIVGDPETIPWEVQFVLNSSRFVGRLDLPPDGLARYVEALMHCWPGSAADYRSPVLWSVDNGDGASDITTLMRRTVAEPLRTALAADPDITEVSYLDGSTQAATGAALIGALEQRRPALILTTGHGQTEYHGDPAAFLPRLGLPIDGDGKELDISDLLHAWAPDGAIWMAQACCSAGSNGRSSYDGLFPAGDPVGVALQEVAALGSHVAPLPTALLGAAKPLRAFIGRVEPTFNWTLQFPTSRQALTADLVAALYTGLCDEAPVGLAFESFFRPIGGLLQQQLRERKAYNTGNFTAAQNWAQYYKICALDRAGLVVLGDPTVAFPAP